MLKSTLTAFVVLATLTACVDNQAGLALDQLRNVGATGDIYQSNLASGYRDYAEERANANDGVAARYFAEKGLLVAQGRDVKPEYPSQMALSAETFDDLVANRDKLLPALNASRSTQPEMAASAMVAYDRWVMIEEQKTDLAAAEDARSNFSEILAKLSEAHTATVADVPTTTIPKAAKPAPLPEPTYAQDDMTTAAPADVKPTTTTAHPKTVAAKAKSGVLYFPLDSDVLGDSAQSALADLTREVKQAKATISVNGHADRLGSEDYNMDLSERRARFVVDALRAAGVPSSMLKYFAYGESDPAIPTADDVGEPKNRRVEVFIE